MGLDGAILLAFILGFPANETVIPIIIMTYAASGTLEGAGSLAETLSLFLSNGWSVRTAVCFIIFHTYALALLNNPAYGKKGDGQP